MKKVKDLLSILLAIAMLLGTVSGFGITAFADGKKDTRFVLMPDYPMMVDVGNTVKYKGFLYDPEYNAVIGAGVTVTCGDVNASSSTDNSGYFELSFTPDTVGDYSVVISYAGNNSYNPTAIENFLTLKVVSRTNYKVSYEVPAAVKSGEDLTVTVNVKDKDGAPVQYKSVNFGIETRQGIFTTNQRTTDSNGNVTLSVTTQGDNRKTRTRLSVFGNDEYYEYLEYLDIYVTDGTAYRITAKSEGSGGNVSGSTVYLENETATVTATEDTLGVFQGWYENGTKVSDDKVYSFTATANRTLTAHFTTVNCIHEKDSSYLASTPKQNATCTATGYEAYYQCTQCSKYYSDENGENEITEPIVINALGHAWGTPSYSWADNNSTVTATRVCSNDKSHIETETVNTSSVQSKTPTCTAKGETTYTASFTNTAFVTQSKTVDNINALGHAWGEVTYTWADDNKTVTATRRCTNDLSHIETETVNTSSNQSKAPTCTAKGETTYTASFTSTAFETQSKTVDNINALGHSYSSAVTNPTCTEQGYTTYTCIRGDDEYTADYVDALGHNYGTEGAARFTCTLCGHIDEDLKANAEATDKEEQEKAAAAEKAQKEKNAAEFTASLKGTTNKGKITLSWKKVPKAEKYEIYATYCGLENTCKKIKTVKGDVTKYSITTLGGKKLNQKKCVKAYVVAYKKENGKFVRITRTPTIHMAGAKTKYSNVKKITLKKKSFKLKLNKTAKIKANIILFNKNKKALDHIEKLRYVSSNTAVVKVDKNGKMTAVGKGKATVYVYAINGRARAVNITVK